VEELARANGHRQPGGGTHTATGSERAARTV
jgi:hypothetical protein